MEWVTTEKCERMWHGDICECTLINIKNNNNTTTVCFDSVCLMVDGGGDVVGLH